MQKTNFVFEAIVHDDASTDNSPQIIREFCDKYPNIIKPIFESENQYSKKDGTLHKIINKEIRGKYIAICEGDDYWTDPLKLQRQVEYMEKHPDCSCVGGQCQMLYDDELSNNYFSKYKTDKIFPRKTVVGFRPFHTASYLYRNIEKLTSRPPVYSGDVALITTLSLYGYIYYSPTIVSVYRKHGEGASSTVRAEELTQDFNLIPYLIEIDPSFPKNRLKSCIYYSMALYPFDNTSWLTFKYMSLSTIYSFSFFPRNIVMIMRLYRNLIKKKLL